MASYFSWFDLMTTDLPAAVAFYTQGLGLTTERFTGSGAYAGPEYLMWAKGGQTFGGVLPLPADAAAGGAPPHWIGYVSTADLDASVAKLTALGGRVVHRQEIPDVGRIAIATDPSGAVFGLFEGPDRELAKPVAAVSWHEVVVDDLEAAWAFYAELFGWTQVGSHDLGPEMGEYRLFGADGVRIGGIMKRPKEMPVCAWTYYVNVPDTDATTETLKALGANLLYGPMDVPGGDRVANFLDPQGAAFAVHAYPKG